ATSCPPPRHNFASLPRIRTESPAFDLHHPEISGVTGVTGVGGAAGVAGAAGDAGRAEVEEAAR
ncbi:cytochrome ubiquinol oxidase subunit I, partial [Streptomyces sp. NPDC087568]